MENNMINFIVAPDFPPDHLAGWHLVNTQLQQFLKMPVHMVAAQSPTEQAELIAQETIDIIYANPFDAATLVREQGFLAVAKPVGHSDEVIIASAKDTSIQKLTDIKPGMTIGLTKNYDIKLIGLRLLEAANLTEQDIQFSEIQSFQAVARALLQHRIDVGFFVASVYKNLSHLTHSQTNVLIESHLADITHVLLIHPKYGKYLSHFKHFFTDLKNNEKGLRILTELHFPDGFQAMEQEEAEFMIDLMDTLLD